MKSLFSYLPVILCFGFANAYAQPAGGGVPMPDFMQKVLICKSDPENDICQVKKAPPKPGSIPEKEIPIGKLSLKGLSLALKKQDVLSILPRATLKKSGTYDGKVSSSYLCGKHVQDSTTNCEFTFGGVEILDVVIEYWGDDVTQITMYFNDYSMYAKSEPKGSKLQAKQNIQDGLDAKYPEFANGEPKLGRRNAGDGVWTNSNEVLKFDDSSIQTAKLDSLVLTNTPLRKQYVRSVQSAGQKTEEINNQQRVKKSTADM